jgi:hypothetical protein
VSEEWLVLDGEWTLDGPSGWAELERVTESIISSLYHVQENAADYGSTFRVVLRVEEVSSLKP